MRVLVTGSRGFIGTHIVRRCEEYGFDVIEVDRKLTPPAAFRNPTYPVPWIEGLPIHPPLGGADAVVHCAAVADIRSNWATDHNRRDVVADYQRTVDLLEQVVDASSHRTRGIPVIFLSSAAVYGDACAEPRGGSPAAEDMTRLYPPTSPYAATKLACEAIVAAYAHRTRSSWYALRLAQVVGAGYHHGHIADFVQRWSLGQRPLQVLDDGKQRKSAVHVRDVADVVMWLLARVEADVPPTSGAYNVAAKGDWSVRDTLRVMGVEAIYEQRSSAWPGDPTNIHLDTSKLLRQVGTYGGNLLLTRTIEDGVRDALKWLGWNDHHKALTA